MSITNSFCMYDVIIFRDMLDRERRKKVRKCLKGFATESTIDLESKKPKGGFTYCKEEVNKDTHIVCGYIYALNT